MMQADPAQFFFLVVISAAVGWLACRLHFKDRIEFWKESKAEREAKAEAEREKQKRLTAKQRRR
jgi:hypothetical protein